LKVLAVRTLRKRCADAVIEIMLVATRNVRHFASTEVPSRSLEEGAVGLVMYERIGEGGRRPSPFSWRIRYALAHKGVPVDFHHVRFADVETIRALSGQHFVPIVTDGDRVIHDSWNIACHLEDRFPDRPPLFGGEGGRGVARLVNHWSDITLGAAIRRLIAADFILCLDAGDRDYYRRSREAAFGCTLEEHCADRPRWLAEFAAVTAPLEKTLAEQPYFTGAAPGYADYILFSVFNTPALGPPMSSTPSTSRFSCSSWYRSPRNLTSR
jgi:glutathione S-transferase